jgi:hypothetical protein
MTLDGEAGLAIVANAMRMARERARKPGDAERAAAKT